MRESDRMVEQRRPVLTAGDWAFWLGLIVLAIACRVSA